MVKFIGLKSVSLNTLRITHFYFVISSSKYASTELYPKIFINQASGRSNKNLNVMYYWNEVRSEHTLWAYSHLGFFSFYHIATKISAIWLAMRASIFAVSAQGAQYDRIALQSEYEEKIQNDLFTKPVNWNKINWNNMFSFESQ